MLRRLLLALLLLACAGAAIAGVAAWRVVRHWDAVVTEKFRTHRWIFPSKIYSDSLLIYPGLDLKDAGFLARLHDLGYQQVAGAVAHKGEYAADDHAGHLDVFLRDAPPGSGLEGSGEPVRLTLAHDIVTRIDDLSTQKQLYTIELEPELISGLYQGVWEERQVVTLDQVPALLLRAIIDTEDQHFYEHHGIDVLGIVRALWIDLRSGHIVQGGSTLTQQLMKNFFLTDERSMKRKLTEALMALIVEHRFSKQQILENYINEIYLGQRGAQGIYGVWEAARFYFGKEPRDLSVAQCATLAALIKAPNGYSPLRDPDRAVRRRNYVLTLMLKQGDITGEQYAAAVTEPLRVVPPGNGTEDAPYFVDFVRKELTRTYPSEVLTSEGLRIYTTLDVHLQHLAEDTVRSGLEALEHRYPRLRNAQPDERLQTCLIAIQPQTGAVRAMVGGRDYRSTQFNRCTQALRQPGSVFKPFTYLAAFETTRHSDHPIQPTTRIEDESFDWDFDHQVWTPHNYRHEYMGMVSVREALEHSLNAATARLAHQIGIGPIIDIARRMGISSELPPYPSVVLGSADVTPFEVAQAYTALANGGLRAAPLSVKQVLDRDGQPVERNPVEVEQAIPADTAYLVTHIMEGVLDVGTGHGARKLGFTRPAAGKTGTTNDYRDAWFAGFTPNLLTVVWVGFDHKRPINLAGAEAALPIWTEFMKAATADMPPTDFVPPPGVVLVRIDPASGQLATRDCPQTINEAFYAGQEPTTPCPLHPGEPLNAPPAEVPQQPAPPPPPAPQQLLEPDGHQPPRA